MYADQSAVDKAGENIASAAQATKDYVVGAAQPEKEETPGFLESTGTAVVNTAQGAVEAVKNTIGMNGEKK
ncbi:hypothetical protein MKW92_020914 [Papaver armeniacum]|nr:hypothetical protein MKW92_020914 [Papaver armeniacum]